MLALGIESTAHTFGVGIVDGKGRVLANQLDQYTTKEGGMIPGKVADHHVEVCDAVIRNALAEAKVSLKDIDVITFAQGPGLGQALRIGATAARTLSLTHNKPLVGVNHCIAHLEIGKVKTGAKDPALLYTSGANTQVIAFEAGKYRVIGETLDMGVGNFLDQFARTLGLGFPGGPAIERLARKGKNYIEIPYVVKGMDTGFGGILTHVSKLVGKHSKEDLCYSVQETVFAMLVEIAERALAHTGKKELVLGGGVACNARLQEMCKIMCKERGAKLFVPEKKLLVDNGAMIAWLGLLSFRAGERTSISSPINPHWRTDQVTPSYA